MKKIINYVKNLLAKFVSIFKKEETDLEISINKLKSDVDTLSTSVDDLVKKISDGEKGIVKLTTDEIAKLKSDLLDTITATLSKISVLKTVVKGDTIDLINAIEAHVNSLKDVIGIKK